MTPFEDDEPSMVVVAAVSALITFFLTVLGCWLLVHPMNTLLPPRSKTVDSTDSIHDFSVISCIRKRRSIFPNQYLKRPSAPVDPKIVASLLEAARWGPYHGKCFAGCAHPARFVVLGKQSMVEMQQMTLRYYDQNWQKLGSWGCSVHNDGRTSCEDKYNEWRQTTQDEITGRWGPVSYMIAIVMRRQTSPTSKRLPEWEEAAAVACSVQNMHLQSTKFPHLACYWSSWHDAARDSNDMKEFLGMQAEDKCLGFFIVAQAKSTILRTKDRRTRHASEMETEWRS